MGTINLSGTSMLYGKIEWWEDNENIANNTSRVVAQVFVKKNPAYSGTTGTFTGYVEIAGERSDGSHFGEVAGEWVEIAYLAKTIQHDSSGNASVYLEGAVNVKSGTSLSGHKASGGATVTLKTIPREASLTSAQDFTDESNPTVEYSNPAGAGASRLLLGIFSEDGNTSYVGYQSISKTATSYTFNLTESERNVMRNAAPNSNSLKVRFALRCVIGSVNYDDYLVKTMTIVNANPHISPVLEELNSVVYPLTGEYGKLIRYVSKIKATSNAYAVKGANLTAETIKNGSAEATSSPAIFDNVESDTFVFSADDSRGFHSAKTVKQAIVDYVPISCNIGSNSPDTDGNFTFNVSGNYFNGNFGTTDNTLSVSYRYKAGDGPYSEWMPMEPGLYSKSYKASAQFSGFDYRQTYYFQARAVDQIYTVMTEEKPIRARPVFDWGENDFNFNVIVKCLEDFVANKNVDVMGSLSVADVLTVGGRPVGIPEVGYLYVSKNSTSPASIYGGSWEQISGRFLLGADSSHYPGSRGGDERVTLTVDQIPSHSHWGATRADYDPRPGSHPSALTGGDKTNSLNTNSAGGGEPHNNMPPYVAYYMWVRVA